MFYLAVMLSSYDDHRLSVLCCDAAAVVPGVPPFVLCCDAAVPPFVYCRDAAVPPHAVPPFVLYCDAAAVDPCRSASLSKAVPSGPVSKKANF